MKTLTRNFKAGMYLFHEFDRSRELYIIQSGKVKIFRKIGNKEVDIATLGAGAVLGEMALIDGKPRSATAKIIEESTITLVGADALEQKIKGVPPWFVSIIKMTCHKIRLANQRLKTTSREHQGASIIIALNYFLHAYDDGQGFSFNECMISLIKLLNITESSFKKTVNFLVQNNFIRQKEHVLTTVSNFDFDHYCEFLRLFVHNGFEKIPSPEPSLSALIESITNKCPSSIDRKPGEATIDGPDLLVLTKEIDFKDDIAGAVGMLRDLELITIRKKESPQKDQHPLECIQICIRKSLWYKTYLRARFEKQVPVL